MTLMILAASFAVGRMSAELVETASRNTAGTDTAAVQGETISGADTAVGEGKTVVVDAGHGGMDAGKVGVNGVLEKEINLSIAQKLRERLEEKGFRVVMIREEDRGLYDEGEANKKQQDMKRRCSMIDEAQPSLAVSIHQNSYTQESVKGPQVFYYQNSEKGQKIAETLQNFLNTELEVEKPREIKANDSYYLLRKTQNPTVIVECGFLSNTQEAGLLATQEYQEKVACAICDGIVEYVTQTEE